MPDFSGLNPPPPMEEELAEPSPVLVAALSGLKGPAGVLGAGGKMGLHVALMLRRALQLGGRGDVRVVAVSRFSSLRAKEEFESRGIQALAADLLDASALENLPDFGTVYFLAGLKFGSSQQPEALRLYNEEMPAAVARRYRNSTIVALSTGCVYSFVSPESGGSKESDPAEPQGDYALSCYGRERAFAEASLKYGTKVALIRLNYSVEYRYGVLVDIAQKVLTEEKIGLSMGYVNLIWQRDAVEYVLRAESIASSPPQVLNVAGTPIVAVRDLAERFGKLFGKTPVFEGKEEPAAWLNDASRSYSLFGPPAMALDEMVRAVAEWLRAGGATHGRPTKFEVRDGKF